MKLHLIDGTYELFRQHFGARRGRAGSTGGLVGLAHTLTALLRQDDVTHVGVAFDHVIESFRNELFDGYKTGAGLPEELTSQFHPAEDLCRALGVVVWPMVEFEADDALATAAARFRDEVDQVIIGTPDKDMAQCVVGDRVVLWDRMRKIVYDEDAVGEKWGVSPASIPDWLALVGDAADGIPGIPRWGAKGSATLLSRYGRIEDIPTDPDTWDVKVRGAASLSENLEARRVDALLYKTLATLRTDAPVPETLDELRWRGARPELRDLLADLGQARLLERIPAWA